MGKFYMGLLVFLTSFLASASEQPSGKVHPEPEVRRQTLNNMGTQHFPIDPYSQHFINACKNLEEPVLEIGAGYGHISYKVLKNGAQKVYVNDFSQDHLTWFLNTIEQNQIKYIRILPGSFPLTTSLFIPESYFQYIFASRVLHFFSPSGLKSAIQEIYRLLKPGGHVIIVAETPYLKKSSPHLIEEYEKRKAEGVDYPGYFPDVKIRFPGLINYGPDVLHCLDKDTLPQYFEKGGFEIIKCEYMNRSDYPKALRLDGRESVGLIAQKLIER